MVLFVDIHTLNRSLNCILSQVFFCIKEAEKELMHAYFGDVTQLYYPYHIFRLISVMFMCLLFFSK